MYVLMQAPISLWARNNSEWMSTSSSACLDQLPRHEGTTSMVPSTVQFSHRFVEQLRPTWKLSTTRESVLHSQNAEHCPQDNVLGTGKAQRGPVRKPKHKGTV